MGRLEGEGSLGIKVVKVFISFMSHSLFHCSLSILIIRFFDR